MPIQSDLTHYLLHQDFRSNSGQSQLIHCRQIAQNFASLENGIAIISDLKCNKSYIYCGKIADELTIFQNRKYSQIGSIWEDELFSILHPDDVLQKHILELQFFEFLKTIPPDKKAEYSISSRLRLSGKEKTLAHKMYYFSDQFHQSIELALCLYYFDFLPAEEYQGAIINTSNGFVIRQNATENANFLSSREKQILTMIRSGKTSKEIGGILSISTHTVNRHRQNVLAKMRADNTAQACALATKLKWI